MDHRLRGQRGDSLLEVVIAIGIIGIAFTAILTGLGSGIRFSDLHRKQATAQTIIRDLAEYLANSNPSGSAAYVPCTASPSPTSAYTTDIASFAASYTLPDGSHPLASGSALYAAQLVPNSVGYWNGTAFSATCPANDPGFQRLTVQVTSTTDSRISETLDVAKRKW